MKLGVRITVHGDSGLDASDDEGRVVKTIFGRESELLFCCLGRQFHIGGDGTEVGHDAEDTLGLFFEVEAAWGSGGSERLEDREERRESREARGLEAVW